MPSITIVSTQLTDQRADGRMGHQEFPETAQTIACTNVADAATKLQSALIPLVGGPTALTHANAFLARQGAAVAPSKHVVATGGGKGVTALYHP
jgi:hypothetical protein